MYIRYFISTISLLLILSSSSFGDDINTNPDTTDMTDKTDTTGAMKIFYDLIATYKKELDECKANLYQSTTQKSPALAYGSYKWEEMHTNYVLPEDVVYGGQNVGLQPLFVVRGKDSNYNLYGKLPMPYSNRDAYLTDEGKEFGTPYFQVLTAKGYSWCKPYASSSATTVPHICRARYEGFLTPGTLVRNSCRVGWGWKTHSYTNYEILIVGGGGCA